MQDLNELVNGTIGGDEALAFMINILSSMNSNIISNIENTIATRSEGHNMTSQKEYFLMVLGAAIQQLHYIQPLWFEDMEINRDDMDRLSIIQVYNFDFFKQNDTDMEKFGKDIGDYVVLKKKREQTFLNLHLYENIREVKNELENKRLLLSPHELEQNQSLERAIAKLEEAENLFDPEEDRNKFKDPEDQIELEHVGSKRILAKNIHQTFTLLRDAREILETEYKKEASWVRKIFRKIFCKKSIIKQKSIELDNMAKSINELNEPERPRPRPRP